MIKIYQAICVFLLLVVLIYALMYNYKSNQVNMYRTKWQTAEANSNNYKQQLEKEHNDKVALDKQYKQLEAKANSDKNFNWYANIGDSSVVLELHD